MSHTALHPHPHAHPHTHPHGSSHQHVVRGGPPVLDIGGDIGAMVAWMDDHEVGTELFLRSGHQPPINVHTGVWLRELGSRRLATALFPELVEGEYAVLDRDGRTVRTVHIAGGELTTIDLRTKP
jgi:hypothetical protein